MLFFGIIWVTSWFGAAWSFNQNLLSNPTSRVLQKKVTYTFQNSANEALQPHFKFWSATILPSRFLKMDWKDDREQPSFSDSVTSASDKKDRYSAKFCSSPQNQNTFAQKSVQIRLNRIFRQFATVFWSKRDRILFHLNFEARF